MRVSIQIADRNLRIDVEDEIEVVELSGDQGILNEEYFGDPIALIDEVAARAKAAYLEKKA